MKLGVVSIGFDGWASFVPQPNLQFVTKSVTMSGSGFGVSVAT